MCIRSSQHFLKCCHVDTKLAHCPSYQKQEKRGSSLLGCLLQKKTKKRDCGKVVPHYIRLEAFCQACTVKNTSLRTKDVGVGAFKIQRPTVEDNFRDVRKHAVKEPTKTAKHAPDGKKKPHREEMSTTKPSVWIPDLYHHPEAMAKREKFAREPAPAPPVSSRPRKVSLREGSPCTPAKNKAADTTRDGRHTAAPGALRTSTDRIPASGKSKPLNKSAEPAAVHRYDGKFSGNAPHLPPARRPPPLPLALQESAGGKARRPSDPKHEPSAASTTRSRTKHQELRHKGGRIYNVAAVRAPKVPAPEYQVYLNAMNFAAENSPSDKHKLAKLVYESPPPKEKPKPHHRHTREEPRRLGLQSILGRTSSSKPINDDGSDASFVCQDSRKLAEPRAGRKVVRR